MEEIKQHPFFASINWDDLLNKRIPPPFKPKIRSTTATDYFDEEFTSEAAVNSVIPEHRLQMINENQERFADFDN